MVVPYGKLLITVGNAYIVILQAGTSLMWEMLLAACWVHPGLLFGRMGTFSSCLSAKCHVPMKEMRD